MASAITNDGKKMILDHALRGTAIPGSGWKIHLAVAAYSPTEDTATLGSSNLVGASGGYTLESSSTGWPDSDLAADDTADSASAKAKDIVCAGAITDARYALLTDANGTTANRVVYAFWDLGGNKSVSSGQNLTLQDLELKFTDA